MCTICILNNTSHSGGGGNEVKNNTSHSGGGNGVKIPVTSDILELLGGGGGGGGGV